MRIDQNDRKWIDYETGEGGSGLLIRWLRIHPHAIEPKMAHETDACFDLFYPDGHGMQSIEIRPGDRDVVSTGIAFSIPVGWKGVIEGRSGMFVKRGLIVPTGTVDAGYRGAVGVMLYNSGTTSQWIKPGDAIGQIGFEKVPATTLREVGRAKDLGDSERGEGGFGSTGDKGAASK